jgi:transcriptional regulator with XRE-family HTH domain
MTTHDQQYLRGVGRRIKLLRIDRDLSQEQLAQAAGVSRNFIGHVEHGANRVDVVRLARLATALNVDVAVLVTTRTDHDPLNGTGRHPRHDPPD